MTKMHDVFLAAALDAGALIMDIYRSGFDIAYKEDSSPVTIADEQAEKLILSHLAHAFPDIPVVAEEAVAAGRVPNVDGRPFILVDPLDGTREFIKQRLDFTVNIALVEEGTPVEGVVYAPAREVLYRTLEGTAVKQRIASGIPEKPFEIRCRTKGDGIAAVVSCAHMDAETLKYLSDNGVKDATPVGSSLKFCLIAEGIADLYPRFGRTMEWDTAAGDAILRAAGGMTFDTRTELFPLRYGKTNQEFDSDFSNPSFISASKTRGALVRRSFSRTRVCSD